MQLIEDEEQDAKFEGISTSSEAVGRQAVSPRLRVEDVKKAAAAFKGS